jgi:ABC-type transporter Mla subunit MlaD
VKRLAGIALVVLSAISLLITLWALIQVWSMRQPVADAIIAGADLSTQMLDTTTNALQVVSASLQTANDTVTMIDRTTLSVAETMSTTRLTVGSVATLMDKDLPASIDASRTALRSAQSSAVVVDNVLTTFSRIPLIGVPYNPAVPLNIAVGDVAKSMDNLPPTFTMLGRNLNTTSDNLDQVVANLNELPKTTAQLRQNISAAQQVVAQYQKQVDQLQKLIKPIKSNSAVLITNLLYGLTFLFIWLGVVQALTLFKGFEMLRGN